MQNIDFYDGRSVKTYSQPMEVQDAEYYTRMDAMHRKEADRNRRKASRMMSFIIALCIISFTAGLVIGIKFGSNSRAEIVDPDTRKAVTQIRERMSSLVQQAQPPQNSTEAKSANELFPKNEFPFVIRVQGRYNEEKSRELAGVLSKNGHTVILSKQNNDYSVFVGPYRNRGAAETTMKKLADVTEMRVVSGMQVVKR